jgi:hypothetical protein
MTKAEQTIWAEMARRKVQFHSNEDWNAIRLWGLFSWGTVRHLVKKGLLLTDMAKENKTVWVWPSEEAWNTHIRPLIEKHDLDELTTMAGW